MSFLKSFFTGFIDITMMMSPWLLLGFIITVPLYLFMKKKWVKEHLGGGKISSILKALLIGIPLPICSCGILPLSIALKKQGTGIGATMAFLTATPQTGVDSFFATSAAFGPIISGIRILVAAITGFFIGLFSEIFYKEQNTYFKMKKEQVQGKEEVSSLTSALKYCFVTIPGEMAAPMIIGFLISALAGTMFNGTGFQHLLGGGIWSMLAVMAIGIPFCTCSSGSIPLAASLITLGASPGTAMVFLITGPATNAGALFIMIKEFGKIVTMIYLFLISFFAILAGLVIDLIYSNSEMIYNLPVVNHSHGYDIFSIVCSIILMILFIYGYLAGRKKK